MTRTDFELSFEFFPPKTEQGLSNLLDTQAVLARLSPRFFSVTFGAGGTTRERTLETILALRERSDVDCAPHLSCIGSTRDEIRAILDTYQHHGIRHLVALRGDMPSGMMEPGDFSYASELVAFIREETGDHFHIEVAAYPEIHPQARSATEDLDHFAHKVRQGANGAITQYFYNADGYLAFRDECAARGVEVPIVPGIMPITNYVQLARFSDACGAEIPRWIRKRLEAYGDDLESLRAFGTEVVTRLCQRLLDEGIPGLHFYTMNRAEPSATICRNLGLA